MPSVCFCKTRVMGAGSGSWGVHQTRDSDGAALEGDPSKLVPLLHKRPSGTPRNPERSEKAGDGAFLACREKRGTRRSCETTPNLLFFEDAPEVLKFNRFVRSGYRAGYTYKQCAKSIFWVHNELGNIWTHLMPLLTWAALLLSGMQAPWDHASHAFLWSILSIFCCLGGSVLYHTFMGCHRHCANWLALDVCGIYGVLIGSQWACIIIGFACYPGVAEMCIVVYYLAGFSGVLFSLKAKSSLARGFPMLALLLLRVSFLMSRPVLGGSSMDAFWMYALAEALAFIGGVVNVCRIPEKWFQPGQPRIHAPLDLLGNSHQIMHVLVFAGMLVMHVGLRFDVEYFRKPEAVCPA